MLRLELGVSLLELFPRLFEHYLRVCLRALNECLGSCVRGGGQALDQSGNARLSISGAETVRDLFDALSSIFERLSKGLELMGSLCWPLKELLNEG